MIKVCFSVIQLIVVLIEFLIYGLRLSINVVVDDFIDDSSKDEGIYLIDKAES